MARALTLFLVLELGSAKQWTAEDLPNPLKSPGLCGQSEPSTVCDPEHLLTSSKPLISALNALSRDYEYPGCGGYEMAVVVVNSIQGSGEEDMRLFAKAVMDHWKVGKAACNNGIVLALAVTDRLMHIATGKGAKEHLPDAELEVVIERMKPLLRDGQYADAAEQAVSDVARILSGESFRPSGLAAVAQYVPVFLFGGIFLFVMGDNCRKQRRYRRCKRALTQIEQERAKATAERLQVESCSICLETFAENKAPTRLLPCGHTFHSACVDGWEESKGTCPICRCSTDTGDAARPGVTTRARAGSSRGFYDDEYRFRIRRAHSIWPEYVSDSMAQRWCAPHFSGPLVADVSFIRSSPSYSSNRGSGSGSSTSFGGGHSGGGGGAGGSW